MPRHNKPIEQLGTEQASAFQQQTVEALNPEIERKHRAAIASSPPKRINDTVVFPITDSQLLEKIEQLGLTKKMESIGKLEWQQHRGKDKVARLIGFIERHGRVMGMSNYAENSLAIRNENKKEVTL